MARGYKVRLGDGSEIGPLDVSAVREWYQQGLITRKSAVLTPGSKRWTTLAEVAELKDLGAKSQSSAELRAAVEEATQSSTPTSSRTRNRDEVWSGGSGLSGLGDNWRTLVAALLLFTVAAGVGLIAWKPQRVLPEFERLPWTETALVLLVLGLCLVRGWEWGRKLVRFAVLLVAVGMFPLMGILVAQGVRGPALLAAGSAWVVFSGLFALLAGADLAWPKAVLAILVILAGGTGIVYFGYAPETEARRQVQDWVTPDRAFTDDTLGVSFQVPPGWRILKKDNPLVAAPPDARLALAQPRLGGFGFFVAESSPSGVASLDQYLNQLQAARRRSVPSLRETGRSDVAVGRLGGRKAVGTWDKEGVRYADQAAVWKDGWVYFALVEWLPEGSPSPPEHELDVLLAGFKTNGVFAEKLQQAVQNVTLAVPHLSPTAAEMLMGQSQARVLEPDQAFRRALDAAARALPTFSKDDTQDFAQITAATYAALSPQERNRLATYVERVRGRQLTSSEDDREMSRLMKAAVLRLPAAKRERLQALYEQAIRSAPAGG
ncbi:MAG TPA: GYF domain-containing protein [Vicinamibacteria bacterium]|nr:GYF domain-containing protein [Vicinamibacteria bacterium]